MQREDDSVQREDDSVLISHTVQVDDYTELTLRIPKVMSALELKALTSKANKIFNLAEVPLTAKNQNTRKYSESRLTFTPRMDSDIYKHREISKLAWDEIAKMMKLPQSTVQNRMYRLKGKKMWNKSLVMGD